MTKYRTIVVDPPWNYTNHWKRKEEWDSKTGRMFKTGTARGAATQYACMSLDQIAAFPIGEWAEDDAHLYLWTTNAFILDAKPIIEAWGFEYKTKITWIKKGLGMGMYYRNTTEDALFAVRGSLKCLRRDVPTHLIASRGRHSEKPAAFYDMVQSMSPGPYLDVFARKHRFGWDAFGHEAYTPKWLIDSLTSEQAAGLTPA